MWRRGSVTSEPKGGNIMKIEGDKRESVSSCVGRRLWKVSERFVGGVGRGTSRGTRRWRRGGFEEEKDEKAMVAHPSRVAAPSKPLQWRSTLVALF